MKRTLCCLALVMAVGCSQSPTAPTPTATTTTTTTTTTTAAGPAVLNLQWAVAPGCSTSLPPTQPAFADATLMQQTDASVTVSWPYQSPTRTGVLYARFVNVNGAWGLCSWDIADV